MEEWGASVEKASGGTIKFKIFPSQQLGKAFDHYDMARDGIADLHLRQSRLSAGPLPDHRRRRAAVLIGNAKGGIRAIDTWYRKYAANEMKDVHYCFSFILDPLTWHSSNKKIVVPGDIKGMKMRPSQGTVAAWVTLLGGTNVQASATEVRDVIEKGVAEAVTFPWGSVPLLGVDKVTKYHMDAPLHTVTFQWLMSPKTYNAMSASQKKVIDDHCTTEWAAQFADPVGRLRARAVSPRSRPCPATRSTRSPARSSTNGRSRPNRCTRSGPTTCARPAAIPTRS